MLALEASAQDQQSLPRYYLAVILVATPSNQRRAIEPAMPEVNRLLREARAGEFYVGSGLTPWPPCPWRRPSASS